MSGYSTPPLYTPKPSFPSFKPLKPLSAIYLLTDKLNRPLPVGTTRSEG